MKHYGACSINLLQSDGFLPRSFVDQAHLSGTFEIAKRLIDIVGALGGDCSPGALIPIHWRNDSFGFRWTGFVSLPGAAWG